MKWNMLWLCAFLGVFYGPKPSLTIAPKFWENHWKTINVNARYRKKHSMVMVRLQQNHWKTIESNGAPEKKHYSPIVLEKLPLLKSSLDCDNFYNVYNFTMFTMLTMFEFFVDNFYHFAFCCCGKFQQFLAYVNVKEVL